MTAVHCGSVRQSWPVIQASTSLSVMCHICVALMCILIAPLDMWAASEMPRHGNNSQAVQRVESGELTTADASWWGFDQKDATNALQLAIDSGAATVIVPNMGKPWMLRPIQLRSDLELVLEDGVELVAVPGDAYRRGTTCLMRVDNASNVTLRSPGRAVLRMQKHEYMNDTSQWRHCLGVFSCTNVLIENITFADSGGDGIYLGNLRKDHSPWVCENVVVRNVICRNNKRLGMAIISGKNVLIEDCEFNENMGVAPDGGLDIEPNDAREMLVDITVRRCRAMDNRRTGVNINTTNLTSSSQPVSILIEDSYTSGALWADGLSVIDKSDDPVQGTVRFRRCTIEGNHASNVRITDKRADGFRAIFEQCRIIQNKTGPRRSVQYVVGMPPIAFITSGADTPLGNIHFDDCVIEQDYDHPLFVFQDQAAPVSDVTGSLVVMSPYAPRLLTDESVDIDLDITHIARPAPTPKELTNEAAVQDAKAGKIGLVSAAWWGFDTEDATQAVQDAIDSGAARVFVPNVGRPWIVRPLRLKDNVELLLADGVELVAKSNAYRRNTDCLLRADNCESVTIRSWPLGKAELRMLKDEYTEGQWRHCIGLYSCKDVHIRDLVCRHSGGDGIYVGNLRKEGVRNACEDVTISRVLCDDHRRLGMAVISAVNLTVEDSIFQNSKTVLPLAGLDIEPNLPTERLVNLVFRRCVFQHNKRENIAINLNKFDGNTEDVSILFEDCVSQGSYISRGLTCFNVREDGPGGQITLRNCTLAGNDVAAATIMDKAADKLMLTFDSCLFTYRLGTEPQPGQRRDGSPQIVIRARTPDITTCPGGVRLLNCIVDDYHERIPLIFKSDHDDLDAACNVTGTVRVRGKALPTHDLPGENADLKIRRD